MITYEKRAMNELKKWQKKMSKKPFFKTGIAKGVQTKFNNLIPEKIHEAITEAIKNVVKVVLFGSEFTTKEPLINMSLEEREMLVKDKMNFYKKAAAVSGAGTGAGGILLGLADLPVLLSLKMKFLFDIASVYGFDVKDYRERLYILYIFQLAFSSQERKNEVYYNILNWDKYVEELPKDIDSFDWRTFQQEYRDYIDLAKLFQLIPGIGAIIGACANYQLLDKLGKTAVNAYRLRLFNTKFNKF